MAYLSTMMAVPSILPVFTCNSLNDRYHLFLHSLNLAWLVTAVLVPSLASETCGSFCCLPLEDLCTIEEVQATLLDAEAAGVTSVSRHVGKEHPGVLLGLAFRWVQSSLAIIWLNLPRDP